MTEHVKPRASRWWLNACLLLAACCVVASWFAPAGRTPLNDRAMAAVGVHAANTIHSRVKPIEQIQLGERVAGRNPLREQVDEIEPDSGTRKRIKLHIVKENGLSLWIELLRPIAWFESLNVQVGCTVDLDLSEMGAQGPAEVLSIGPCPEILPGDGPVVTGKFTHETDGNNVVSLRLEGEAEPTGVTTNHLYWSEDRKDFIPAGDLRDGETVNTLAGTRRIASIAPVAYIGLLNNLETTEHVFRTGNAGSLVHNICGADFVRLKKSRQLADDIPANRIFHMSDEELDFVGRVRAEKPNLQIHRSNQKGSIGDFLIIDRSNPNKPLGFLVELKGGGRGAGNQLSNLGSVFDVFDDLVDILPLSGTIDGVMSVLKRGRSAFP